MVEVLSIRNHLQSSSKMGQLLILRKNFLKENHNLKEFHQVDPKVKQRKRTNIIVIILEKIALKIDNKVQKEQAINQECLQIQLVKDL